MHPWYPEALAGVGLLTFLVCSFVVLAFGSF